MWEALTAIGTVWGVVVTIMLFYVTVKSAKIDKLEDRLDAKAERLIDARFSTLAAELNTPIAKLATIVDGVERRLQQGDQEFDKQSDQARTIELKLVTSTSEIKNWAMATFATREEAKGISDSLHEIQIALATQRHGGKR